MAIGLVDSKTMEIVSVIGTGFMVHSNGIIATAKHVVDDCIAT